MAMAVRMHRISTVSVKDVALSRNVVSMPTTSVIILLFKAKAVFQQALTISISISTMEQIQVPTFVTEKGNHTM